MAFRCLPMPADDVSRWRKTGVDDAGNVLLRRTADADAGFPCRACLRNASTGEVTLLGSWTVPEPRGVYASSSPVFVHERDCAPLPGADVIPETARTSLLSLRSYDADGLMLYDLGVVVDGTDADAPLRRALDHPKTAFVNIHTARPGCWLARAERA